MDESKEGGRVVARIGIIPAIIQYEKALLVARSLGPKAALKLSLLDGESRRAHSAQLLMEKMGKT
eukprot:1145798-Pyramimonas_sp.AAC.2